MRPVRQRAHAATIFALFWMLFSVGAVAGTVEGWRHGSPDYTGVILSTVAFVIQIASTGYALHLWRTEKPSPANEVEGFIVDDLLDMKPEAIKLADEKTRLKRIIVKDVVSFLSLLLFVLATGMKVQDLAGIAVFSGGILSMHIAGESVRYAVLKKRAFSATERYD